KEKRFHAIQAILLSWAGAVLLITCIGAIACGLAALYMALKTYTGEKVLLPVIGEMAQKYA
ncbi:MAG: hypothetical protein ABIH99_05495, partial [Candidatus Micrarchaeota archaeon]